MANSDLTIERAALGRVATIGDFYDARRDKFVHGNLFNRALPREYTTVHRENTVPSKVDFHLTTTTKEKMESMKLKGEIGVSFLCGMVAAEGSGGFLNEKRNNSKTLDCVYSQNIRTEIERVNLNHDDISSFVKENSISSETTHIVVGIIRGCNTLVNLSCTVNEDTTQSAIKGQLKGEVEKFGKLAKSNLSQDAELTDDYKNHINDVKLTVFTDAAPAGGLTPRTIEEGFKIIEAISAKMTENSKERGVPINYELLSIKEVARILEKTFQLGGVFKTLDIRRIEELKNLLCEAEEQILRINEFSAETEKNKNFFPKERVQEIKKMQVDCEIYSPFLQQEVSRLLVASREDPKETEQLIKLSSHFQGSQLSDDSMDSFFEKHEDVVEVFRFLEEMRKLKVTLVRAADEFRSIKRTKTATILFFSLKDISAAENLWNKATEVFLDICESQKKSEICAVVNTDRLSAIAQIEEIEDGPRIVKIEGRQYITKDLVGYQESAIGVSTVACTRNIETSRDVSKVLSPELLKGLTSDLVWQCLECFGRLTVDEDFPLLLNCG